MALTVLNVAYPFAPVGPDAVGGAEQVLTHLDAALTQAGHRSLVVASEGAAIEGTLYATPGVKGPLDDATRRRVQAYHRQIIEQVLARRSVDVVHLHGIDFHTYLPSSGVPALVTLHLPPSWYPSEVFRLARPQTYLHCVSASQRRACPPKADLLPVIENGVPTDGLPTHHATRSFVLALGRICPEKGFHLALAAAAQAGRSCLLAGTVYPYSAHQKYFQDDIVPRLDGAHRYLGPLGQDRKRRFLAAARALLVPSQAPETSSLVAMEALACGTPVIAFPAGALSDIVEHGTTGFVIDDVDEMAEAIERAGQLDAETCRQVVRERFEVERMTAQYLDVYERLARSQEVPRGRKRASMKASG